MHFGDSKGHDASLWQQFLEDVEQTQDAVVIGVGDYLDWTRAILRPSLAAVWGEDEKTAEEYDTMVMETFVYPFVDGIRKHCPSFSKKCLGLIEGNHHAAMQSFRFRQSGRTSTEEICGLLGVTYLGLSAWLRLGIRPTRHTKSHNLNIVATHSTSASANLPASLASAGRLIDGWRDWDIFLTANDHKLGHDLRQVPGCTQRGRPRMIQHDVVVGRVGSFQKGFTEEAESSSYVERKFLKPSRLGWLSFEARVESKRDPENYHLYAPEVWRFEHFNV